MYEMKKACIYARVSTDEQVDGYSIDEQIRMCKAAIEAKGWECVKVYSDPGISGRTMKRPGLQEMMAAIAAGEIEAVFVYKLDRLSRKIRDTLDIFEDIILEYDVALISLRETLDTSTPWGRASIGIISSISQLESETIAERTHMGRKAKVAKGGYAGGKPPYGYKAVDGELVIVPEEAEVVRYIYKRRAEGGTYVGIADELNAMGKKTKSGKPFQHSSVVVILKNEDTYRGNYRYGKSAAKNSHEAILKGDEK